MSPVSPPPLLAILVLLLLSLPCLPALVTVSNSSGSLTFQNADYLYNFESYSVKGNAYQIQWVEGAVCTANVSSVPQDAAILVVDTLVALVDATCTSVLIVREIVRAIQEANLVNVKAVVGYEGEGIFAIYYWMPRDVKGIHFTSIYYPDAEKFLDWEQPYVMTVTDGPNLWQVSYLSRSYNAYLYSFFSIYVCLILFLIYQLYLILINKLHYLNTRMAVLLVGLITCFARALLFLLSGIYHINGYSMALAKFLDWFGLLGMNVCFGILLVAWSKVTDLSGQQRLIRLLTLTASLLSSLFLLLATLLSAIGRQMRDHKGSEGNRTESAGTYAFYISTPFIGIQCLLVIYFAFRFQTLLAADKYRMLRIKIAVASVGSSISSIIQLIIIAIKFFNDTLAGTVIADAVIQGFFEISLILLGATLFYSVHVDQSTVMDPRGSKKGKKGEEYEASIPSTPIIPTSRSLETLTPPWAEKNVN